VGVEEDGGRLRLIDIDPEVSVILARPVFDVESAAAHAQGRVRADDKDGATVIVRSWCPSQRWTGWSRLDDGLGKPVGSRSRPAQPLGERRASARPRGGRGITAISIGRRGFARGYARDDRRRVERIADAPPPHGEESCRGSRPASNTALFDILRLLRNVIALARQSPRYKRATLEP
jgi:hypothetical protein